MGRAFPGLRLLHPTDEDLSAGTPVTATCPGVFSGAPYGSSRGFRNRVLGCPDFKAVLYFPGKARLGAGSSVAFNRAKEEPDERLDSRR